MSNGLDNLIPATRTTGMAAVSSAAAGSGLYPIFLESQAALNGAALLQQAQALDAQAAQAPSNLNLRMQLLYAAALARDTPYTAASGRFHYALGVHTALRGLYEGGRTYIDANS